MLVGLLLFSITFTFEAAKANPSDIEGTFAVNSDNSYFISNADGTWGELPIEQPGYRSDFDRVYEMLEAGFSVAEVIRVTPSMMRFRSSLEQTRQDLLAEKFRNEFRLLDISYIFGGTGLGKTRHVMERYGYENVCQVTGYQHGCFDKYRGGRCPSDG